MSKEYDEILFLTIIIISIIIIVVMVIININIVIIVILIVIMKRHCCYLTVSGLDEKSLFILLDPFLAFIIPTYIHNSYIQYLPHKIWVMAGTNLSVALAAHFYHKWSKHEW